MIVSESKAFQINDIFFAVGASGISIQKEALSYKFHVLRQNSSSKLPTGHGGCIVNVSIRVPREDVLKLHRLILQVKQNPFVFIENKLLRQEICPGWDSTRNMAFSVLNLGLESVPGNVGLFDLQLQMQWFNYFPYSAKFWFREDWETEWISIGSLSEDAKKLLEEQLSSDVLYIKKSIFDYTTKVSTTPQQVASFDELMKRWTPAVFDLLPINSAMVPSKGVQNPRDSRIYVRYYNQLQHEALIRHFGIDVVALVGYPAFHDDLLSGVGSSVSLQGVNNAATQYDGTDGMGDNVVSTSTASSSFTDARTLPELLAATGDYKSLGASWSSIVIEQMLKYDHFELTHNEYLFVDLPPSFKSALSGKTNEAVEEAIEFEKAANETTPNAIVDDIPQLIKDHVSAWEFLLTANHVFRAEACKLLVAMIEGRNATGIKYAKGTPYRLHIAEVFRKSNASYGAKNSYHKRTGPDGTPNALAMDLNLADAGSVGNHLDKLTKTVDNKLVSTIATSGKEAEAVRVATFYLDYGYVVHTAHNSSLLWGGSDVQNAYDERSEAIGPVRRENAKTYTKMAITQLTSAGYTLPPNLLGWVYPQGPGIDAVHVQHKGATPPPNTGGPLYFPGYALGVSPDPWYKVFDRLNGQMTQEDTAFFGTVYHLDKQGWKYYSRDPSVNGVFYKPKSVTVEGNREFNGRTNSHDTIFSKWSATLRHIVTALPILSHEFPTHQHLGSIDPVYRFEFVTVDHGLEDGDSNRDGIGPTAVRLERARTTLANNGRDIKTIYDSWMADADTFITRLMGSYGLQGNLATDHTSAFDKYCRRVVISASQAETLVGQPGTSVYILQCEEAQPFVNETLTRTNTAKKSSNEDIIRKIIKKAVSISDVYHDLEFPDPGVFDAMNSLVPILGVSTATFQFDEAKQAAKWNSVDFLKLKQSKLNGNYNPEELRKIESFCHSLGALNALAELILWEEKMGGPAKVGKNYDFDFYGLESLVDPKGAQFFKYTCNSISGVSKLLMYIVQQGTLQAGFNAVADRTALELFNVAAPDITGIEYGGGAISNTLIAGHSAMGALLRGTAGGVNFFFNGDDTYLQEALTLAYLKDVFDLTGSFALSFVSATSDFMAGWITSIIPQDPASSVLNGEVFGIAKTCIKQINMPNASVPAPPAELGFEKAKAGYIKQQIASLAQTIFADPFLLDFFEITEEVAELYNHNIIDEKDALPDLNLPPHPYFAKTYLTPPDFYYYNEHEDGSQASNAELHEDFFNKIKGAVDGVHDFSANLQSGEVAKQMAALGGDITAHEVTASYDGFNHTITSEQEAVLTGGVGKNGAAGTVAPPGPNSFVGEEGEGDTLKFGGQNDAISLLGSNFGSSPLYTPVIDPELLEKVQKAEAHFGKTEGYANERKEIVNITGDQVSLSDTASFAHFTGKSDLFDIVKESSYDITGQKFTMKRAFPTFRLYMIEEDQSEDFLIRYDDFYHYNAIRDITVVRSREIAGDTAVIVMQNISGILDGSKRMVLKDTDYMTDEPLADGRQTSKGKTIQDGRNPTANDTGDEEPMQSIILRPGVNVQLRMGYGNDPNNLEVKLSGRVIDLAYSANGDQVEITVQGFGSELVQVQKGLNPNDLKAYTVTHRLLGALMFEPELQHFGRFEVGRQLQLGENKDAKLDFRVYKPNAIWDKLTNVYFANTSNQIADIWDSTTDAFIPSEKGTIGGFAKASVRTPVNLYFELPAAMMWDSVTAIPRAAWRSFVPRLKNEFTKQVSYALTGPQDDNLFCPNPKDYVEKPNWFWAAFKGVFKDFWKSGQHTTYQDSQKVFGKFANTMALAMQAPKLKTSELEYVPQNVTIFQIFREMTLRHPGYCYAAVPYGKEFRYTMFFGVPSQRYWAKPAHNLFISRTNQLRKQLGGVMGDATEAKKGEAAFTEDTYAFSDLYTELKAFFAKDNYQSRTGNVQIPGKTGYGYGALDKAADDAEKLSALKLLGVSSYAEALLEYYQALTLRFIPFRRYHMATSETDIIANTITATEYAFANAVSVKYYNHGDGDATGTHEQVDEVAVKIHDAMPEEQIRMKSIDYKNCKGSNLALRYGTGELVYEAKRMYQGEVLLVGNSRIKPWDVVVLVDRYNDIVGPVEVEQVVDRISFETGYITEIKPNAMVFANEISSFPILEGVKQIIAGKLKEEDAMYNSWKYNIPDAPPEEEGVFDTAVKYAAAFKEGVDDGVENVVGIPVIHPVNGIQSIFMSGAWLMGGLFYLMKCAQGQSVIIYPLLKHGIPFIAGVPAGRPETLWSIFNGQVNLFLNDLSTGTLEFISHWKLLGFGGIQAFTQDAKLTKSVSDAANNIR